MRGGRSSNPYWPTWLGADPLKQPATYELVKRYMRRPAVQLYRSDSDPYELDNLADQTEHREIQWRLANELDSWMKFQSDPGVEVDTARALRSARKGKHLHGPKLDRP